MPGAALAGLRVVDLTQHVAGPYCTKLLADFGAAVVKVERPNGGDPARRLGPFPGGVPHPEKSGLFLYLNTNKRGVTLNLQCATGRDFLKRMVREADVVVESLGPGTLEALGLGYEALRALRPSLVLTSISPFGLTGPYAGYQGEELVTYALGGMAYITGKYDREPVKHGLSQAQYLAGVVAATVTLAAYQRARASGEGCLIDVSTTEALMSTLFSIFNQYAYAGVIQRREPINGGGMVNSSPVRTSDGYVTPSHVGISSDWRSFIQFMGAPALEDPKFETPAGRVANASELDAIVNPIFETRTKDEWFHEAQAWRFPFAPVQNAEDIARCPQLEARSYFVEVVHPEAGALRYPGPLFRLSESPRRHWEAAPLLGQHNLEVYQALGVSKEELEALTAQGVV